MGEFMNLELTVNGFKYEASFTRKEIEEIIKPLIYQFQEIRRHKGRRIIVFLAAPPAVGKSTFAVFLEQLSKKMEKVLPVQHLSLDGFHHKNEYLKNNKINIFGEEMYLSEIKGMPETFNLEKFKEYLKRLKKEDIKWPIYDRVKHDVVDDQIKVDSEIVLIEGNWLLQDEEGWRDLKKQCDYSIFIKAKEDQLKERLVNRKIRGGLMPEEALAFYNRSDGKNVRRVMDHHLTADLVLKLQSNGELRKVEGEL